MFFNEVDLTSSEALRLRMLKAKVVFRSKGFNNSRGVIRMYLERHGPVDKQHYKRVRNVYGLVSTDQQIIERFELMVDRIDEILDQPHTDAKH
jgi:hypothetical protein